MTFQRPRALLLLEVFLDLTDSTLALADLDTPEGIDTLRLFAGSIYTKHFHPSARAALASFRRALEDLGFNDVYPGWRFTGPYGSLKEDSPISGFRERFEDLPLCPKKLAYWEGWQVKNLSGKDVCFRLHAMHDHLGHPLTAEFFQACTSFFSARRSQAMVAINRLDEFFGESEAPPSGEDLKSSTRVETFLREFMVFYFKKLTTNEAALPYAVDSWNDFAFFLEKSVLGSIWAKPCRAMPRPTLQLRKWERTHLKAGEDGSTLKVKLLTEVPLHITDSEAVELIWERIQADVDIIIKWANAEADAVWAAYRQRIQKADEGIVSRQGEVGVNTGLIERVSRKCPDYLAHAAATYEEMGHSLRATYPRTLRCIYPRPFGVLARELGIPNQVACAAFAALIVCDHPNFNASVLEELELFNDAGKMEGFSRTEKGWRLTGYKRRRGEARAQVTAHLSAGLAERIHQIIAITEPLRKCLKDHNDPAWKRLFLAAPSIGARPTSVILSDWTHHSGLIEDRLQQLIGLAPKEAADLAGRLTLSRLRASCGALVYFRTQSVQAMSEALGHSQHDPRLLSRYLPPILQEFFVERWVRLFQTGIICEAMKDTQHLLRATGFSTQKELDSFLSRATGFPGISDPTRLPKEKNSDGSRVLVAVSPAVLRILLALREKATEPHARLNAKAQMWSDLGSLIVESVRSEPDLLWMLEAARELEAPTLADEAIYA